MEMHCGLQELTVGAPCHTSGFGRAWYCPVIMRQDKGELQRGD